MEFKVCLDAGPVITLTAEKITTQVTITRLEWQGDELVDVTKEVEVDLTQLTKAMKKLLHASGRLDHVALHRNNNVEDADLDLSHALQFLLPQDYWPSLEFLDVGTLTGKKLHDCSMV